MRKSPLDTTPERRPLRIFAFDPMLARAGDHRVTIENSLSQDRSRGAVFPRRSIGSGRLRRGGTQRYFRALNLNDPNIAMLEGLEPLEHDPHFHQQMVYAVASSTGELRSALGRPFAFAVARRASAAVSARLAGRNAYFDNELNAVLFGYFPADEEDPGQLAGPASSPACPTTSSPTKSRMPRFPGCRTIQRAHQSAGPGAARSLRRHRRALSAHDLSGSDGARATRDPGQPA